MVHSLALTAWQMAWASAKVLFAEHCQLEPSFDPPHTEQLACFFQLEPFLSWSEQQRTYVLRVGGTGAVSMCIYCTHVMGCVVQSARTSCSSFVSLSPAVSSEHQFGCPHRTGRV